MNKYDTLDLIYNFVHTQNANEIITRNIRQARQPTHSGISIYIFYIFTLILIILRILYFTSELNSTIQWLNYLRYSRTISDYTGASDNFTKIRNVYDSVYVIS